MSPLRHGSSPARVNRELFENLYTKVVCAVRSGVFVVDEGGAVDGDDIDVAQRTRRMSRCELGAIGSEPGPVLQVDGMRETQRSS